LLGIINIKYTRVFDLLVQEENAEENQETGLQAGGQGIEAGGSFAQDIDNGDDIKQ
jgi:hypothetical protein